MTANKDFKPSSVEILERTDGPVVVYLFPNSTEITKTDRRAEFDAAIGRFVLTQSFFIDEMVWQVKSSYRIRLAIGVLSARPDFLCNPTVPQACLIAVRARTFRAILCLACPLLLHSQTPAGPPNIAPPEIEAVRPQSAITDDRIFGVIPNYQTVDDPHKPYVPLRVRDKWLLFVKESVDPFTVASAAAGAGISQSHNSDPKYGEGFKPYLQRFGAAQADLTSQNFFADAVLASLFHEDPRYFRKGPGSPVFHRVVYALSRAAITRRDSGRNSFNFSGTIGMGLGIVLSNAYYPPASVSGGEMESRLATSFAASALGNLLPEFWPDMKAKFAHYRHH